MKAKIRKIKIFLTQYRGGVIVDAMGAIAPKLSAEKLVGALHLHPQFKRIVEYMRLKETAATVLNS